MPRHPPLFVLALLLAACGPTPPGTNAPAAEAGGNVADAPVVDPSANAPATTGAPAGGVVVALDGDGIRLVDPESGASRPLAFGTARDQATETLADAFGSPPVEQATNAECGAGPILHVRWPNGFVGLFQDDRFLGWDARARGLATADGIGIGSTRSQVEASREIEVEETSLGTEFRAGGLGGVFESAAADAPLVALWAGLTCLFR